jgi:hypothetical protein
MRAKCAERDREETERCRDSQEQHEQHYAIAMAFSSTGGFPYREETLIGRLIVRI